MSSNDLSGVSPFEFKKFSPLEPRSPCRRKLSSEMKRPRLDDGGMPFSLRSSLTVLFSSWIDMLSKVWSNITCSAVRSPSSCYREMKVESIA